MQSNDYDALLIRSIYEAYHHVRRAQGNLPNRARELIGIAQALLDEAPLKMSLLRQSSLAEELDELIDRLDMVAGLAEVTP